MMDPENSTLGTPGALENEKRMTEMTDRLKQLEMTLSELRSKSKSMAAANIKTKKGLKGRENQSTFGILPSTVPFAELFQSSPESMVPPALVFLLCIVAFLLAKVV